MIWVIGGTSDALSIVDLLLKNGYRVLVSTTTAYGSSLAEREGVQIVQQKLDLEDMLRLIERYRIYQVIDASHPYAEVVSGLAIKACNQVKTSYIRYERKTVKVDSASYYSTYAEIINQLNTTEGNILLTIGSNNLHLFQSVDLNRIVARVLSVKESIEHCESLGLKAHQIIAMKGRMNMETNLALMKEYNIKHLVTKDTGEAGGFYEKLESAQKLDINVHVLEKPKLNYPTEVHTLNNIINAIQSFNPCDGLRPS